MSRRSSRLARRVLLILLLIGCQTVDEPSSDGKCWGEPVPVDENVGGVFRPQIAVDAMGNQIAVWDQPNKDTPALPDSSDDLWSNHRAPGSPSWDGAALREEYEEEDEPDDANRPRIGLDAEGNALVVYVQHDGVYFRVMSLRYFVKDGWTPKPECIQSTPDDVDCDALSLEGHAWRTEVAVDPRGNAVVVWQATSTERESIWSNRLSESGQWGGAQMVVPNDINDLLAPDVAMDDSGHAIAVWEQFDGERSRIRSQRQMPSGEWVEEQPVAVGLGDAFEPRIAADAEGNAIAVWQQQVDDRTFEVWANRYLASTRSWEVPAVIGPSDAGDASNPEIAMDAEGNAVAVWAQSRGALDGVWSNRYDAGAGWRSATHIGPRGLGGARSPQIAMSPDGHAVAVWLQFDGFTDRVGSNRSTSSGVWGRSEFILAPEAETRAIDPQVAIDPLSNATAIWLSESPAMARSFDLFSSRLDICPSAQTQELRRFLYGAGDQ